jgi:hypothetical protein
MSTLGLVRRPPNGRAVDYIIDLETTVWHQVTGLASAAA